MKKIAIIALIHPRYPHLFLHGKRRDNQKWCVPSGHFEPSEHPIEAANRELFEETGLKATIKFAKRKSIGDLDLHLFVGKYGNIPVTNANDPDSEFSEFKFLDPNSDSYDWHVPKERNLLIQ